MKSNWSCSGVETEQLNVWSSFIHSFINCSKSEWIWSWLVLCVVQAARLAMLWELQVSTTPWWPPSWPLWPAGWNMGARNPPAKTGESTKPNNNLLMSGLFTISFHSELIAADAVCVLCCGWSLTSDWGWTWVVLMSRQLMFSWEKKLLRQLLHCFKMMVYLSAFVFWQVSEGSTVDVILGSPGVCLSLQGLYRCPLPPPGCCRCYHRSVYRFILNNNVNNWTTRSE